MTRINLGIMPQELCDQHLVAEYRELPRMFTFANDRLKKYNSAGPCPSSFTLNTGHMSYFIPYGTFLSTRWKELCLEMDYRGIVVNLKWRGYPSQFMNDIDNSEKMKGRLHLIERIKTRISTMKRKPLWTNRFMPSWVIS